ncbi:hypothetical protein BOTNAR_0032g00370 [Botryotinia narcissicola]|uniref:Uncharacterized protein n=1 Tax=Botryotinia narcissicola TaxID=278944 RepID=A0A4Z1J937_9HELO|nr:hypothetical protein BOTNAR_0032g00370 [Botryotinia narcissicola]
MDIDTQLGPLPEIRKRSRNLDSDSDEEEPQAQRARNDNPNSIPTFESEMAIDTPARNVMVPPRRMHPRVRFGRRMMSRQKQEQISSTFANIGAATPTPNSNLNPNPTQLAPVSSLPRVNRIVQASTTRQSPASTSQSRLYEEISDYDADTHENKRPPKRRRDERQNSVHTPDVPTEDWNGGIVSETTSSPISGALLAIETPPNQIASTRIDTPYIDLTLEDLSDEEEDAVLPAARSVLPTVQAPSVLNNQPHAKPTFVDLTFDDSSDDGERTTTMSQAYIGDKIVLVEEKSLEPFLPKPTTRFRNLLEDARTQKLHRLNKWHSPEHKYDVEFSRQLAVLGTSGNVYMAIIKKKPECNCYEGIEDILCVHIVFDGQLDITCGNCRAPWVWVGRELSFFIETAWNLQYDIDYKEAGYRSLSELLKSEVSEEGYFNVAELVGIAKTMEDDAEAHRSYQRVVHRWRLEMAGRSTTLLEEMGNFIYRYHPTVYDGVDDGFSDESNDGNSPRAMELGKYVEMNVGRVLQGLRAIDSEVFRDLHLL